MGTPDRGSLSFMHRHGWKIAVVLALAALPAVALAFAEPSDVASRHGSGEAALPPTVAAGPSLPDTIPTPAGPDECPLSPILESAEPRLHSFYMTRGAFSEGFRRGWGRSRAWATDFPKSDRQFLYVLRRLLDIDAAPCENPISLADPRLRYFPFLYVLEVGGMELTREEAEGLRGYLLAGGFLLVDDFWGTAQWANFEREMRQVLPEYDIVEIPMDHPVFHIGFEVNEILQVPSRGNARSGVYYERDGTVPYIRGIFDDDGRLMVGIAWNSDLGDAWEWAEQPDYPRDRSDFAFKMGINFLLYSMTH